VCTPALPRKKREVAARVDGVIGLRAAQIVDGAGQRLHDKAVLLEKRNAIDERETAPRNVLAEQHFGAGGRNRQRRVPGHLAGRAVVAQKGDRRTGRMGNHQRERRTAAQNADRHRKIFGEQGGLQRFDPVIELLIGKGQNRLVHNAC
jgi:hypothetical protein